MSDFDSMLARFSANAHRYKFEQRQEEHDFTRVDDAFADSRRKLDQERRAINLAHLIAEQAARDDVLCHAVQEELAGGIWLNVEHPTITGDERDLIAIAIAYLDARGLIERCARFPHLVRINQQRSA
jgi:hypothetical protein